jgi:hypothetical protein
MAEYVGYEGQIAVETSVGVYSRISNVRDLNGPGLMSDPIDASHRGQLYKNYLPGRRDGGDMTFELVWDPGDSTHNNDQGGLLNVIHEGRKVNFRVTFPDAASTTCTFEGFVTRYEIKSPLDGFLGADVTVKINGALTWA